MSFEEKTFKWLMNQKFYHGYLPREDLPYVLKKKGDFIFRVTERTVGKEQKKDIVLSIAWPTESVAMIDTKDIKNYLIERSANSVWLDLKISFHSIDALYNHYRKNELVHPNLRIKLGRPICLFFWEFKHSQINLIKKVGKGAYGEVFKGTVTRGNKTFNGAIKAMRKDLDAGNEKMKEVMAEARLMRSLNHPNIVRCRGIAVLEQPVYIVIEFINGGGLDSYLKKNSQTLTMDQKNRMAISAAWGIEFMHSHDIIHRDIAARNCLYDNKNLVKLSDFGLSRKGSVYRMKKAMKMPTKWLAPESLTTFTFSGASDVYTFGVLLYEIYTCQEPYLAVKAGEAKRYILSGAFPNFTKQAPPELNEIVKKSIYQLDPAKRDTMKVIVKKLETWLDVELVLDENEKPDIDPESNRFNGNMPIRVDSSTKKMRNDTVCIPPPETATVALPNSLPPITVSARSKNSRKSTLKRKKKKTSKDSSMTTTTTNTNESEPPADGQVISSETMSVANKMVSDAKGGSPEMLTPSLEELKPSSQENETFLNEKNSTAKN
ncbi:Tyrosine-protein kinase [Caenorhabditis elegans]|uniref:Tyrosine-protein kinase n=1 Tax=Caenorhabditis elegans TaxID=6239 RepID=Q22765_CAEEL|nr:Tyrosine-protein kinase [Caenorhabditis elegans]CAA94372.1 Tyrosine-protein kinase [Caenorhabditis elegans]|eukprot:NP_501994.1 Tyrosine-protein kinase [Caenorhabditis elegans]